MLRLACTPASGWEKGQVENQVGLVRERFFTPRLRFRNYEELNGWLLDKCVAYAKAHRHVDQPERTIGTRSRRSAANWSSIAGQMMPLGTSRKEFRGAWLWASNSISCVCSGYAAPVPEKLRDSTVTGFPRAIRLGPIFGKP